LSAILKESIIILGNLLFRSNEENAMGRLSIDYPDNFTVAFNQSKDTFEQEAKMAMAVKLFEMGRLTSGQAAYMAGVSRVQFLLECSRFGVPSVYWEQEEIEAELDGV
jgi:predicted HTH domain antitoxin